MDRRSSISGTKGSSLITGSSLGLLFSLSGYEENKQSFN
jgi:hypothetical protein